MRNKRRRTTVNAVRRPKLVVDSFVMDGAMYVDIGEELGEMSGKGKRNWKAAR